MGKLNPYRKRVIILLEVMLPKLSNMPIKATKRGPRQNPGKVCSGSGGGTSLPQQEQRIR
jgi:hypothetical protein